MWKPRRLTILWASTAFYRDSFTLFFFAYLHEIIRINMIVFINTIQLYIKSTGLRTACVNRMLPSEAHEMKGFNPCRNTQFPRFSFAF
jgi:hypothetical protein